MFDIFLEFFFYLRLNILPYFLWFYDFYIFAKRKNI